MKYSGDEEMPDLSIPYQSSHQIDPCCILAMDHMVKIRKNSYMEFRYGQQ